MVIVVITTVGQMVTVVDTAMAIPMLVFLNLATVTVPDFVYVEKKIAIYLDGMSGHLHGNPATELVDRLITDKLDELGWKVIRIQYPELNDPQVMSIYFKKLGRLLA